MADTYCPLPWLHRFVLPSGKEIPCCSYQQKNTFESFDHIKEKMLLGEKISGCVKCYESEEAGIKSIRQHSIEKYGNVKEERISSVEIAFDNLCNFKCRSCSSLHSHLIRNDEIEIMGAPLLEKKFYTHDYYNKIDYKNLKEFKAHGGEPLISPNFKIFCERIVNHKNIYDLSATITTNGSIIPAESVYDFIKLVKKLTLIISIDGLGELNEYIRSLSVWSETVSNLKFFDGLFEIRENKETEIIIHTAVSSYNVNKLQDLDRFIRKNFPRFKLSKNCVQRPEILSISNLPENYKMSVLPTLKKYPDIERFLLIKSNDFFNYFVYIHNEIDRIRNASLEGKNDFFLNFIKDYEKNFYNHKKALKQHALSKEIILKKNW